MSKPRPNQIPREIYERIEHFINDVVEARSFPVTEEEFRESIQDAVQAGYDFALEGIPQIQRSINGYIDAIRKRYAHRLNWFEYNYPRGLGYLDEDGTYVGINVITKSFIAMLDEEDNKELLRLQEMTEDLKKQLHDKQVDAGRLQEKLRTKYQEKDKECKELGTILESQGQSLDQLTAFMEQIKGLVQNYGSKEVRDKFEELSDIVSEK